MIAGTIARLTDTPEEPLETEFNGHDLPGLHVKNTQTTLDNRPIQSGKAATRVEVNRKNAAPGVNAEGDVVALHVERAPELTDVVTDWVADVTGSGLLAASSVTGDDQFAFPFDLFRALTGSAVELLKVDVKRLHRAWVDEDQLDVWMTGSSDDDDATSIQYHEAADVRTEPTFGLGFVKPWSGTVERGVVYESGYVSIYSSTSASAFIQFVEECLLPFCYVPEDDFKQETLADGDTFKDEVEDHLDDEGVDFE